MPDTHLILGGCGFIGRHVAILLARQGHDVILADRAPSPAAFPADVSGRISWRLLSLADAVWDELIDGVSVVHHYAWASIPATANADPSADLDGNVKPTLALLDAMQRRGASAPRLVFTSSGGTVYGRLNQVPVQESHPLNPLNAYGAGKAAAELYISAYRNQNGLDCRIARLSNPYGAGQNLARGQGAVTTFLYRALNHEPISIWGDGEAVRDYIHVADAAAGLVTLACTPDAPGAAHIFNIGSGQGVSLNGIINELEAELGRTLDVRREPARPYDVPVSVLDVSLVRDTLEWVPRLSFVEGIKRTLADLERGSDFSSLQ